MHEPDNVDIVKKSVIVDQGKEENPIKTVPESKSNGTQEKAVISQHNVSPISPESKKKDPKESSGRNVYKRPIIREIEQNNDKKKS